MRTIAAADALYQQAREAIDTVARDTIAAAPPPQPRRRRPNLAWPVNTNPGVDPLTVAMPGHLALTWRFGINDGFRGPEQGNVFRIDMSGMDEDTARTVANEAAVIAAERFRENVLRALNAQIDLADANRLAQPAHRVDFGTEMLLGPRFNNAWLDEMLRTPITLTDQQVFEQNIIGQWRAPPLTTETTRPRRPAPRTLHAAFIEITEEQE